MGRIDSRPRMAAYGLENKIQKKILKRMTNFIYNLSIGDKVSPRRLYPFQVGILTNISALPMLHKYVRRKFGFRFIITNRINQDPLEQFFSRIRSKGGGAWTPNSNGVYLPN